MKPLQHLLTTTLLTVITCLSATAAETVNVYLEPSELAPKVRKVTPQDPILQTAEPVLNAQRSAEGWLWIELYGQYSGYIQPESINKDGSLQGTTPVRLRASFNAPVFTFLERQDTFEVTRDDPDWIKVQFEKAVPAYFLKPSSTWEPDPSLIPATPPAPIAEPVMEVEPVAEAQPPVIEPIQKTSAEPLPQPMPEEPSAPVTAKQAAPAPATEGTNNQPESSAMQSMTPLGPLTPLLGSEKKSSAQEQTSAPSANPVTEDINDEMTEPAPEALDLPEPQPQETVEQPVPIQPAPQEPVEVETDNNISSPVTPSETEEQRTKGLVSSLTTTPVGKIQIESTESEPEPVEPVIEIAPEAVEPTPAEITSDVMETIDQPTQTTELEEALTGTESLTATPLDHERLAQQDLSQYEEMEDIVAAPAPDTSSVVYQSEVSEPEVSSPALEPRSTVSEDVVEIDLRDQNFTTPAAPQASESEAKRYKGQLVRAKAVLFSKPAYPYALEDDNGKRIAWVDIENLLLTKPLNEFLDKPIVVYGSQQKIEEKPGMLIYARQLWLR